MATLTAMDSGNIGRLTALELGMAERKAGLSLITLEDPNFPKVDLLAALGWVWEKRTEPTLTFDDYRSSRTLDQIVDALGLSEDDAEDAEGKPSEA